MMVTIDITFGLCEHHSVICAQAKSRFVQDEQITFFYVGRVFEVKPASCIRIINLGLNEGVCWAEKGRSVLCKYSYNDNEVENESYRALIKKIICFVVEIFSVFEVHLK